MTDTSPFNGVILREVAESMQRYQSMQRLDPATARRVTSALDGDHLMHIAVVRPEK